MSIFFIATTSLKNHLKGKHAREYAELSPPPAVSGSKNKDGSKSSTNAKILAETGSPKKRQLTLKEATERKLSWDINDPKSMEFHYLIGEMIALDNEPLSLVERVGFTRLIEKAVPQYKIPGRTYMTQKILPDIYNRISSKIEVFISQATAVSVTSDIWTCQHNKQSFLSFTAHWISPKFILQHGVLAMKSFSDPHTGYNIAKELNSIADKWNIPQSKIHFIVHDSAANMIKGVREGEYDSAKCFIHTLQRAIEVSLEFQEEVMEMITAARRIVTHFNHSGIAQEKLKCIQRELNLPNHQLVQDITTRWNSSFYLMERLIEQKRAVSLYITDNATLNNLTPLQWTLMEQCIKLLKPFEEITKITSSGISCISEVIPHVVTLLKYLEKENTVDRTPKLFRMRCALTSELKTRFNFDQNEKYLIATYLDPRFKTSFLGIGQSQRVKQKILLEALKISCDESSSTIDDSSPQRKKRNTSQNDIDIEVHENFWNCFEEIAAENSQNDENVLTKSAIAYEIDVYVKTVRLDRSADPYKWWSENSKQFPKLTDFAKVYLSSPGSSVYSERLFSEAGVIYEEKRNRLLSSNAEKIVLFTITCHS